MPKLAPNAVPSYRLHKQSGQAIVTVSGRDVLLGKHGDVRARVHVCIRKHPDAHRRPLA